jgi:hypothetical protein
MHLRLYCERIGDSLWGEPVNTLSSLAFLVSAWLLWRMYLCKRSALGSAPEIPLLIFMVVLIGIGSTAFHAIATMGAVLLDVIPIVFFVFLYLYVFARLVLSLSVGSSALLFTLLVGVNIAYKFYVVRAVDGFVSYLPTFLFLLLLALYMLVKKHDSALRVTFASLLAFASLYFRTVDKAWCELVPFGTHFLWHLFNAVVIYMLVRELMLFRLRQGGGG